jgi:hypothetical protein
VGIAIDSALGGHSGFLTLGDNNTIYYDQYDGGSGTPRISSLVEPGWIIGVARGMIPWFGAIKLIFDGNAGNVSATSWEFLGLTIAGLICLAIGIHYVLRREGIESPIRRREEERARPQKDEEEEEEPSRGQRFMAAIRPWHPDDEEPERKAPERAAGARRSTYEERRRSHFVSHRERPRPHAHRPERKRSDDDDDL